MPEQHSPVPVGERGCYTVRIDDMNFQVFNANGQALGLVWEVTGTPGQFRCAPTSNTGRPIHGGVHISLTEAAQHCVLNAAQ